MTPNEEGGLPSSGNRRRRGGGRSPTAGWDPEGGGESPRYEPDGGSDSDDGGKGHHGEAHRRSCPRGLFFLSLKARRIRHLVGNVWSSSGGASPTLRPNGAGMNSRRRQRGWYGENKADRVIHEACTVLAVTFSVVTPFVWILFRYASNLPSAWPPILIRRLDFSGVDDVGGWTMKPYPFPSLSTLGPMEDKEELVYFDKDGKETKLVVKRSEPDFGGLEFNPVPGGKFYRTINPKDEENFEAEKNEKKKSKYVSHHWAFDDDHLLDPVCRRPNWWGMYHPNCNYFHEFELSRRFDNGTVVQEDHEYESAYVSHGFFRDVWLLEDHSEESDHEVMALKMLRWKHGWTFKDVETVRMDALIMERLTSSPRIVDIYGHCSMSITVEAIENEVEDFVVPGDGYAKPKDLNDSKDVNPKNKHTYTVPEKLDIALAMAESIADLHGFEGGIIVHDDIQLCQWLKTNDGVLKLGDFNRAEIMYWDEENKIYCKYNNGKGYGNYRSPEEFAAKDIDEKIDVFSFGNNIYGLLTGLWVFYEYEDDGVVQQKLIDKELAYVDDRYRTRSYIEGRLVEIMERCWIYEPSKRPDIFEVVEFLRETKAEHQRREAAAKKKAE